MVLFVWIALTLLITAGLVWVAQQWWYVRSVVEQLQPPAPHVRASEGTHEWPPEWPITYDPDSAVHREAREIMRRDWLKNNIDIDAALASLNGECGYMDEDGFTVEVCRLTQEEHGGMGHPFGARDDDDDEG